MEGSGRVALVAGASAGFGRETALELAQRGYQVFGGFRGTLGGFDERASALREAAAAVGGNIEPVALDVTDGASVTRVVHEVRGRAGRIDALINVAGIGVHGPWPSIDVDAFRGQLETNLVGMYRMCLAVEPVMREQGEGYIVNVSSDAGIRAAFWEVAYSASKYGVEGMSFGMRLESQQFGIRVCVVEPGWYTDTEYEQRMVSTVDWDNPAGPYADLVRTMMENQPKVETGKPGARAVGVRIADILAEDDPPFQNPVGASPVRTASYPNWEEYEQRVFGFYSLERFRGPWARHTQPA
jgi:NAD(P)-dependent dehydrogenase (short-subunit alcohol dehydrogenase family)